MRARTPVRSVWIVPAIFGPLFVLFWALSGDVLGAAKVTGVLLLGSTVLIPFVLAMILAPVAIHELGHLWAGRRAGFGFGSLHVGPWTWDGRGRRTDWGVGLPMGLCVMHPPGGLPTWREAVLFAAGGPLASLAAALLGLVLYAGSGGFTGINQGSLIQLFGFLLLIGNGGTLVGSLWPARVGGLRSDGLVLLDLWRRRAR